MVPNESISNMKIFVAFEGIFIKTNFIEFDQARVFNNHNELLTTVTQYSWLRPARDVFNLS